MLRNSDAVHGGFAAIIGSIYERGVERFTARYALESSGTCKDSAEVSCLCATL